MKRDNLLVSISDTGIVAWIGTGFGILGFAFMLLFWIGLIFLSVWLVKGLFQGGSMPTPSKLGKRKNPVEILDQRYARGEINRAQYEVMKKDVEEVA